MKITKKYRYLFCLLGCVSVVSPALGSSTVPEKDYKKSLTMPLLAQGPIALVRYLEGIHDEVALNVAGAEDKLRDAIIKAGEEMLRFPVTVWHNADNLYALMTYLFIGGNPKIAQALLKDADKGAIPKYVIDGTLAYAYHDTELFLKSFDDKFFSDPTIPIDLRMAACLGTALEDALPPKTALKRLDLVRLTIPGSLLEEAALRREALLAHYGDDKQLLKLLAHDYMARFANSPYEKMFWHAYAVSMVRLAPSLSDEEIDDYLEQVPKDIRYVILSHIARSFLVSDNLQRAHIMAEKGIRLATYEHFPSDAVRFYYAASSIGSTEIFQAKKILDGIDIGNLSMRDRALFIACLTLEKGIIKNNQLAPVGDEGDDDHSHEDKLAFNKGSIDKKPSDSQILNLKDNKKTTLLFETKRSEVLDPDFEVYLDSIKLPVPKLPHISDLSIERENKKIDRFLLDAQSRVKALENGLGDGQ